MYNEVEVKAILIAVHNIENVGLNSKKVLLNSIEWLRCQYEITQDESFLIKAVWHIYAYLELGYPYISGELEFNRISPSAITMCNEKIYVLDQGNNRIQVLDKELDYIEEIKLKNTQSTDPNYIPEVLSVNQESIEKLFMKNTRNFQILQIKVLLLI